MRGAFALWVLFTHLLPWAESANGAQSVFEEASIRVIRLFSGNGETHPAVLGFIVLSGYCIHRNGFRHDDLRVKAYAIRRVFRIVPVYVAATALGIVLFLVVAPGHETFVEGATGTPAITLAGTLAKLSTIAAVVPSTYAESFQGNAPLVTVAAEMWLYAVYALVAVILLRRRLDLALWPVLGVAWVLGAAWVIRHPQYLGWWHIGSLFGFLPYWWLGAQFVDPSFVGRRWWCLAAAAAGWVALSLILDGPDSSLYLVEIRKMCLAVLIGGLVVVLEGRWSPALAAGGRVGKAGYSIYAIHAPVVIALLAVGVIWPICAAVAIGGALVVFSVYEWPLTRYGARRAAHESMPGASGGRSGPPRQGPSEPSDGSGGHTPEPRRRPLPAGQESQARDGHPAHAEP